MPRLNVTACSAPLAAALILGLSGCSNNPYPPGQTSRAIQYRFIPDDPRTLDPTRSYRVDEARIVDLICPSFYQYHPFKTAPYELQLALGAEEPKREPYVYTETVDGKPKSIRGEQWTFRLKKGLRFQDDPCFAGGKGREITAKDLHFSFLRMADPSTNCPIRSFIEDKIVGYSKLVEENGKRAEKGQPANFDAKVDGVQLDPNDPYTLRIRLNQPYPQLRYLMAMHFTTPIPREGVEKYGKEFARRPIGCGPYTLEKYFPRQRIVLKINPNRRPEIFPSDGDPGDRELGLLADAGKQVPLSDEIHFLTVREATTAWNLFTQGYQDVYTIQQENYAKAMSRAGQLSPDMQAKGMKLFKATGVDFYYFGFNMRDPVVGGYTPEKRKLRQAISLAIDSQQFIDLFSQGHGKPAQFLIPPGLAGYDPEFKNTYRSGDLDLAKRLLAEAGYPGGISQKTGDRLSINYENPASSSAERQSIQLAIKQVARIGVTLVSRSFRDVVWQDKLDKGQFQFSAYGWVADYPDPENFLFLLYGPNRRPGPNATAYDNPKYNRLFEQMRSMDDGPERLALIKRLRDIAAEDCPLIYREHTEDLFLTQPWIRNVKPHGMANDSMKYRGVDGPMRAGLQQEWNKPILWPAILLIAVLIAGSIPAAAVVNRRRNRRLRRSG